MKLTSLTLVAALTLIGGCKPADPVPTAPYFAADPNKDGFVLAEDLATAELLSLDPGEGLDLLRPDSASVQLVMKVVGGPRAGRTVLIYPENVSSRRPPPSPGPGR